jgi:acetyl-CoA acetyltransferase
VPYGVPAGAPRFAMMAQRYLHHYGLTDDALARLVLTCRAHAQLNPRAVWYGMPLTRADYDASDIVASPLRVLDCDFPVDGAVAVVLAAADRAPDLRSRPVYIEACAHSNASDTEWEQWPDYVHPVSSYIADQLWRSTSLTADDVDVAEVYDGFSFIALQWLEDLGFCEPGGAGAWLAAGNGALGGKLPVCTDGGQLGGGRLHGMGKLAEAVQQLRGECGDRQVDGAEVAVAAVGTSPFGAAILLTQ